MRQLVHLIGPGERAWFRRCRRAWDFGSPNRQNLEPQTTPFDLRRAVRYAMSVWYFPGMWEWPREIVWPRALQAFDEALLGKKERPPPRAAKAEPPPATGAIEEARQMLDRYFSWAPTVDAFTPVRIEADFEANVPDLRTPGHDLVDGTGRPVRYMDRLHLLIVDRNDEYWIVEHRLVDDGWADEDELLLAERPVAAAWGWEQFYLGLVVAGTVHNELRVSGETADDGGAPRPAEPGTLPATPGPGAGPSARHPRSRDWARSRAAGRMSPSTTESAGEEGRSPVTHAGSPPPVVQEEGDRFRRTWIRRTRPEIETVGDRLWAEALEMLDPAVALYPTPAPESCSRCAYRPPCLAMNQGTEVGPILEADYDPRDPQGPEEGRLGGGSWSMNRGAAPPAQWRSPPSP